MGDEPGWKHVMYILRCHARDAYQERDQALARVIVDLKARVEHLEGRLMCQGVVIDRIVARVQDLERMERARETLTAGPHVPGRSADACPRCGRVGFSCYCDEFWPAPKASGDQAPGGG
jgi:hypothetical protein